MAKGRRTKKRTHARPADNAPATGKAVPKCFIVRSGADISRNGHQLVRDLRHVMEPNTASRLKERRSNRLKDYLMMSGPLGVTHIALLSETEETMNLRLAKFPRGPTIYFRVLSFSLTTDIRAANKRLHPTGMEFATAPLLVLNNFAADGKPEHKLVVTMLQNFYPTVNPVKVRLSDLRRVALYSYDPDSDTIEFRHYLINIRQKGEGRLVKKLRTGQLPAGLAECLDIGDFIARASNLASESEPEDDALVAVNQKYPGVKRSVTGQRAVTLTEIGPRLSLRLIKITDELNEGKVLYYAAPDFVTGDEMSCDKDCDMDESIEDDSTVEMPDHSQNEDSSEEYGETEVSNEEEQEYD